LSSLAESKCPETTLAESIHIVESITKKGKHQQPIGLVLDVKSRHVLKQVWSIVVDTLRTVGIRVEGIVSFSMEDIRDMSQYTQQPAQESHFSIRRATCQRPAMTAGSNVVTRLFSMPEVC
jgi:hypothetical protein